MASPLVFKLVGNIRLTLQCKFVNARFSSKHFLDYETPHPHDKQNVGPPASSLGHLLPKGEGKLFPTLSRGDYLKTRYFRPLHSASY